MMKRFKTSLHLALCTSLALGSFSAFGADGKKPAYDPNRPNTVATTAHGYNPGQFCKEGAGKMMSELNNLDDYKNQQDKIDVLRERLQDIEKQRKIIDEIKGLKSKYEESLASFEKTKAQQDALRAQQQKAADVKVQNSIDDLKGVIRNGMILSVLSTLLEKSKDSDFSKADTFTMSHLCKNSPESEICREIVEEDKPGATLFESVTKTFSFKSKSKFRELDNVLASFKKAYDSIRSADAKKEVRIDAEAILKSIPKDVQPDVILKMINEQAPEATAMLESDLPKERILDCLNEKKPFAAGICEGIASTPVQRDALIKSVSGELSAVHFLPTQKSILQQAFEENTKKYQNIVNNIVAGRTVPEQPNVETDMVTQIQEMDQVATSTDLYESLTRTPASASREKTCKEAKGKLSGLSLFFFQCPELGGIDDVEAEQRIAGALKVADSKSLQFRKDCSSFNAKTENSMIKECKDLIGEVAYKISNLQDKYTQTARSIQNDINQLTNANYNAIENMRKYVAEKYLRSCNVDSKGMEIKDESIRLNAGCSTEPAQFTLNKVYGLSSDVAAVIGNSFAKEISAQKASSTMTFSPNEMRDFLQTCQSSQGSLKTSFQDVCEMITKENSVVERQDRKEQVYKDPNYYYDYDTKSNSVIKTKKKSGLRVFGEGVLPVAPSLIPMWFNNYQTKQNINILTDQAIFQKQMLHTFDIYNQNPWMYNYGYFGYGNPFATTTATSTTSTGFNFGQ